MIYLDWTQIVFTLYHTQINIPSLLYYATNIYDGYIYSDNRTKLIDDDGSSVKQKQKVRNLHYSKYQ